MKEGVLVYQTNKESNIFNIGDYIQSLAAMQFCNNDNVIYINRECLDQYSGDEVKLIMNGWFMHSPMNWPPSNKITPLFVAFHLNKLVVSELLDNKKSLEYFREHQPIGCRDRYTESLLREKGIEAYFSGCLTLTLGLTYKADKREDTIYFVDVPVLPSITFKSFFRSLYIVLFKNKIVQTIYNKRNSKKSFFNYIKNILFIEKYSRIFALDVLQQAEYLEHEIMDTFHDDTEKFKYAKELLGMYSKAKFVVTSRIHCALPCLAMETPVLYVYDKEQDLTSTCRMDGLIQLFNIIEIDRCNISSSLFKTKVDHNVHFENKNLYKKYRDDLIARCKDFCRNNEK